MPSESISALISFLVYFSTGLAYFVAFTFIYLWITPYSEIKLIRTGNMAASVSLSGALIGYSLPLARAIEQSESAWDLLIWATAALVIQIIVFLILHLIVPHLSARIKDDKVPSAIFLAAMSIAIGLITAASMTI